MYTCPIGQRLIYQDLVNYTLAFSCTILICRKACNYNGLAKIFQSNESAMFISCVIRNFNVI